ncbi:MAG: BON domain-containing protein [Carboxydocellales bacterium]
MLFWVRAVDSVLIRRPAHDADVSATHAIRSLLSSAGLSNVKVFVFDGIAFLTGWVASPDQSREAEEVIQGAKIVSGLSNEITVAIQ